MVSHRDETSITTTAAESDRVDQRLHELYDRHRASIDDRVAQYYEPGRGYFEPESTIDGPNDFGLALASLDGEVHCAGDADMPFAIQSISKVFAYLLVLADHGREYVMTRVGVEPSGDSFNSIVFDSRSRRPYNPMVNAGALVTADLVGGHDLAAKRGRILSIVRRCAANPTIDVDWDVFEREIHSDDRNRATAYLLRSQDMIDGEVEDVLSLYLQQCSMTVTSRDLAIMAATFANGGVNPVSGERVAERRHVRDVLSVMYTCGMYDFAGEWAFDVGVPAKSGVSGGIMAAVPGKLGIGVYSGGLDVHGNSVRGIEVCQEITGRLGLHLFASDEDDAMLGERDPDPT